MANSGNQNKTVTYQIRLNGHLDDRWNDWFGSVEIDTEDNSVTCLTCEIADQAALHGLLRQIRDLGIPLISINRIDSNPTDTSNINL